MPHSALRRAPQRPRFDHGPPMSAIDTRPLVFVALIVAVVFLLAASQTRTHALLVDIRPPLAELPDLEGYPPVFHRITVTGDDLLMLDGRPIDAQALADWLNTIKTASPRPEIAFEPEANASYALSLHTLGVIWRAGLVDARFCFGGLEKHQHFDRTNNRHPLPLPPRSDTRYHPDAQDITPRGCTPLPLH